MNQSSMMIRVEVAALSIEREFRISDTFTVGESIDAVVSLLSQEFPEIHENGEVDFYIEDVGFLSREALLKDMVQHPSERIFLL